jgi:hypothetical protein
MPQFTKMPFALDPSNLVSETETPCDFCGVIGARHTYVYPGTTKKFNACDSQWCQAGVNLTYLAAWHKIKRVPNSVAFEGVSDNTACAFRAQTLNFMGREYWGLSMFTAVAPCAADFIETPEGLKVILNNIMGQTARVLISDLRADNRRVPDADWKRIEENARAWLSAEAPK